MRVATKLSVGAETNSSVKPGLRSRDVSKAYGLTADDVDDESSAMLRVANARRSGVNGGLSRREEENDDSIERATGSYYAQ